MTETQSPSPRLDLAQGTDGRSRFGTSRASDRARPQQSRKERFIEGLKTLLWVVPLTALIWIWAEREQIATGEVHVPIKVNVAADRVAVIEAPVDQRVYLELSGPRASIDAVRDRLADRPTSALSVPLDVAAPFEGEVIGLAEIITRSNDIFTRNAVTVTRVRPAVKIRVERKEVREVPVQVRPENRFEGTITFEPATVTIEGPERFFLSEGRNLAVYADMSAFIGKPPGQYQELVSVNLENPAPEVSIRPPRTVTAKVQIRPQSKGKVDVPAFVLYPTFALDRDTIKVKVDSQVRGIDVAGPPEIIEQFKRDASGAYVQLELGEEVWKRALSATAPEEVRVEIRAEHYHLPDQITVLNPDRTVTVTLIPRPE